MEYKGFDYSVVQTANPTGWKWSVQLDKLRTKVGTSFNRASAIRRAEKAIEEQLKRKRAERNGTQSKATVSSSDESEAMSSAVP
jgi:hypothetical protein